MNWLQKLILGRETVDQIKALGSYQIGRRYEISGGRIISPPDNFNTYIRDGYSVNDIIYSVVNIILDKVRLPEWAVYKVVNESSLKKYRSLIQRKNLSGKDFKRALELKETSLEPVDTFNLQTGKLDALLKYPNSYCTFQDLITEAMLFKLLTGNDYLWGDVLRNGANAGIPNSINLLPSQFMNITVSDTFPAEPVKYTLYNWNQEFLPEQILHNKYPNPNWDINGMQLYGMSPLKAALKNIIRNNSAKDAATAKFQNGGLEEVLYMDDERFTAAEGQEQLTALKVQLSNEFAGPTNQGKKAISGYKIGKVGLGLSPVELAIIESEKWDAIMFCNIYGVPPELLGLTQKTYNNVKEAEKALTTRSALPLLTSIRNDFNRKIAGDWGGFEGYVIDYDVECFTELQVDMVEVVNTTSKMMMVTPNEEREAMGWEARPEKEADEVWVMQGGSRVPLSDFQVNPVDQILNNVNGQGNNANGNGKVSTNSTRAAGVSN